MGAGKVLVDFLGAMVLEQMESDGEQEQIGLTLI